MKKLCITILTSLLLASCSSGTHTVNSYLGRLFAKNWDSYAQQVVCIYRIHSQEAWGMSEAYLHKGQTECPRFAKIYTDGRVEFITNYG